MLLEFRTQNYKSFVDELVFSMIPAPKQKGLDYSILKDNIGKKSYKGLSTAVIYGPNASGKTNIIGAMEALKYIIVRGNIRNGDSKFTHSDAAATNLELIPNRADTGKKPVDFSIKFIDKGLMFDYKLSLDLGEFLDEGYSRKVLVEKLHVNEKMLFSRTDHLLIGLNELKEHFSNQLDEYEPNMLSKLATSTLNDEELFLMNGFKNIFSPKLVDKINTWLEDKFMVYYRADSLKLKPSKPKKDTIFIDATVNEAAKIFGVNSNSLGYASKDDDSEPRLVSLLESTAVNAEIFESYGTIRFVYLFPVIVEALLSGGTLVVDEFDASLHPMALMNIINIFHNDDLNKKNAQLIFNTHNPIFLNSNLFRRDEIKFVERDDETFCSTHYSLSDFGTSGQNGVRMGGEYMKNYFISQYGAIKDIDFTPVIEKLLEDRGRKL
ncbi:AAA family ATPase [Paenibacillus herberti]|uniref:Abortive phage infection protein n=1 Tax=Paenibacillus herberti TaxID=1619309 RepID=A0A229NU35_9BACL|nr:ATP-binding protein [Paenibacillus herberti]OXM13324.1 abortive phage infection protein [Paenibacillus herberti]